MFGCHDECPGADIGGAGRGGRPFSTAGPDDDGCVCSLGIAGTAEGKDGPKFSGAVVYGVPSAGIVDMPPNDVSTSVRDESENTLVGRCDDPKVGETICEF